LSCFKILFNQDRHGVYPYECEKIKNYFIICGKNKGVVYLENEDSELNLVKKTCKELGVNQKQLAEITGFSINSITRWNKGDKMTPAVKNHLNLLLAF